VTLSTLMTLAATISSPLALKAKYRLAAKHNSIFKLHTLLYSIDFFPTYATCSIFSHPTIGIHKKRLNVCVPYIFSVIQNTFYLKSL
jgi:hypothetical protein